jgi:hypothetical protein
MLGKEHQVVVLPLGGDSLARSGVENELAEIKRITEHVYVLVDSERATEASKPAQRRLDFAESCRSLDFDICVLERRAIENYFTDPAVKSVLGTNARALAPFENPKLWPKAADWRIARNMEFRDIASTDLGLFIQRL